MDITYLKKKKQEKYDRSLELILRELETTDKPEYYQFCLARHYLFGGRNEDAKKECLSLIKHLWDTGHDWKNVYASIHYTLFTACWYLGDHATPLYWIHKVMKNASDYLDLHWCWAMCCAKNNDVKSAEIGAHWYFVLLEKYLKNEVHTLNQLFTLDYDHILLYQMANMYDRMGKKEMVIKCSAKLKACLEARGVDLNKYILNTKSDERETERAVRESVQHSNA